MVPGLSERETTTVDTKPLGLADNGHPSLEGQRATCSFGSAWSGSAVIWDTFLLARVAAVSVPS